MVEISIYFLEHGGNINLFLGTLISEHIFKLRVHISLNCFSFFWRYSSSIVWDDLLYRMKILWPYSFKKSENVPNDFSSSNSSILLRLLTHFNTNCINNCFVWPLQIVIFMYSGSFVCVAPGLQIRRFVRGATAFILFTYLANPFSPCILFIYI